MFYKNHAHTIHSVSQHLGFHPRKMFMMYIIEVALREIRAFLQGRGQGAESTAPEGESVLAKHHAPKVWGLFISI